MQPKRTAMAMIRTLAEADAAEGISELVSDMHCALERDSSLPRRELPEKSQTATARASLRRRGDTHSIMALFNFCAMSWLFFKCGGEVKEIGCEEFILGLN